MPGLKSNGDMETSAAEEEGVQSHPRRRRSYRDRFEENKKVYVSKTETARLIYGKGDDVRRELFPSDSKSLSAPMEEESSQKVIEEPKEELTLAPKDVEEAKDVLEDPREEPKEVLEAPMIEEEEEVPLRKVKRVSFDLGDIKGAEEDPIVAIFTKRFEELERRNRELQQSILSLDDQKNSILQLMDDIAQLHQKCKILEDLSKSSNQVDEEISYENELKMERDLEDSFSKDIFWKGKYEMAADGHLKYQQANQRLLTKIKETKAKQIKSRKFQKTSFCVIFVFMLILFLIGMILRRPQRIHTQLRFT